ncbi:S1C family serine protease [Ornithinimicrobium tianjinense]|nr:trypsin-like peptidase domain-containing protein [Ornithinimicrobium tianjinense]
MTTSPQGPDSSSYPHRPDAVDPTAPNAPTAPYATPPAPRQRRRFGDVAVASVLAAALASGGTYAAVRAADDGSTVSSSSTSDEASGTSASNQGTTVALTGEKDWRSIATEVTPSVVSIDTAGAQGEGAGSGVVWDDQGHVVTNAHVVEGAQQLRVVLSDGRAYPATVVGTDVSSDLAVVKLDTVPDGLTPIKVGDDELLAVGDPVMAVGNPLGLSGTVTTGIVSALDRPVTTQGSGNASGMSGAPVVTNAIQTSAAINPGNSGGALLNGAGELVGINSSIAALPSAGQSQAGSIGIGFAIPATKVRLIADQLISTGTAQHAFLGVTLGDGEAETDGATLSGAEVGQVEPSSPAEQAGLQAGDLIIGIDGESVSSATALVGQVRERGTGDEVTIDYVRQGQREEVTVTLAARPDEG